MESLQQGDRAHTFLNTIDIPAIKEHFGCSGWRVSDLCLLGRQDGKKGLIQQIRDIAFGSVLHTVHDSFAVAHATREKGRSSDMCVGTRYAQPPRVLEFHTYAAQDGERHDEGDTRDAMAAGVTGDRWPEAVEVTSNLFYLQREGARWAQAKATWNVYLRWAAEHGHPLRGTGSEGSLRGKGGLAAHLVCYLLMQTCPQWHQAATGLSR